MANLNPMQLAHARHIVVAVRRRGLSRRYAVIAIETALTESRLRMYANRNNPASLALPHEAVGRDHGSVGLFQQQVGGARNSTADWGTTAQLMDAGLSTGKFLDALGRHDLTGRTNWQAAQSVQRSAFADGRNYRANDAEAERIVSRFWVARVDSADGYTVANAISAPSTSSAGNVADPPPGRSDDYVVRAGDTLFAIAARAGITWRHLAELNQLADPNLIIAGQHLHVPPPAGPEGLAPVTRPIASTSYTVRPGDSLFAIAQKFGTTWQHLVQLNHLPDPDLLHPGQEITVG
jgi:LysM repeat protein